MDQLRWKVIFRLLGMLYWLTINQLVVGLALIATLILIVVELFLEFVFDRENILSAQDYLPVFWEWEHHNLMYVLKGDGKFQFYPGSA